MKILGLLLLWTSVSLTKTDSEGNRYPDIQISAFQNFGNASNNLNIVKDALEIKSPRNVFTIVELRCTALCPIQWRFKPAKEKLKHVFTDMQIVVNGKISSSSPFSTNLMIINSTSNEMTGAYRCECTNSTQKKEIQIYWHEQGKSSFVNAGTTFVKVIDPTNTNWVELPCGYSDPSKERFLYRMIPMGTFESYPEMARSSNSIGSNTSIMNDAFSGFKLNITELPSAFQHTWICAPSKILKDWRENKTLTVRIQFRKFDAAARSNASRAVIKHHSSDCPRKFECCQLCSNCSQPLLEVHQLHNGDTANFLKPLVKRRFIEKMGLSEPRCHATPEGFLECEPESRTQPSCSSLPITATKDTFGFIVECTTNELDMPDGAAAIWSQSAHTEYEFFQFDATSELLPICELPRAPYLWKIFLSVGGITVTLILLACSLGLKRLKDENPDVKMLYGKYRACCQKWKVPRNRWTIVRVLRPSTPVPGSEGSVHMTEVDEVLGEGNFGIVLKARLKRPLKGRGGSVAPDGIIAVKRISERITQSTSSISFLECLLKEIDIMITIQELGDQGYQGHPNIVTFLGLTTSDLQKKSVDLLMEYCANGSTKSYLKRQSRAWSNDPIAFAIVYKWCMEIARGLQFLGEHGIIHIDVAARNILMTENLVAKLSDFGLSRKLYEKGYYNIRDNNRPFPFDWAPVEASETGRLTAESDVWSFGVTIWEIFSLGEHPNLVLNRNGNGVLPKPRRCDAGTYEKMLTCWDAVASERPTFASMAMYFENAHQTRSPPVDLRNQSTTSQRATPRLSGTGTTYRTGLNGVRQNVPREVIPSPQISIGSNGGQSIAARPQSEIGFGSSTSDTISANNSFEQDDDDEDAHYCHVDLAHSDSGVSIVRETQL